MHQSANIRLATPAMTEDAEPQKYTETTSRLMAEIFPSLMASESSRALRCCGGISLPQAVAPHGVMPIQPITNELTAIPISRPLPLAAGGIAALRSMASEAPGTKTPTRARAMLAWTKSGAAWATSYREISQL